MLENRDGAIVGYWFLFAALHAEPLWIDPAYRVPGASRRLIRQMQELLGESSIGCAFAIIAKVDHQRLQRAARVLGFQKLPGYLYFLQGRRPQSPPTRFDGR